MEPTVFRGISPVIPVYNEEDNIEKSVSDAVPVLASLAQDYEIIFVESGRTGCSAAILDRLATENDKVKVIHFIVLKGPGLSVPKKAPSFNDVFLFPRFYLPLSLPGQFLSGTLYSRTAIARVLL